MCAVRVADKGSAPHCIRVEIQGFLVYGLIDCGADITIMGRILFCKVVAFSKLKKRDFHNPDRTPQIYDQKAFFLDERIDLEITFVDKITCTTVYVEMDAHDQLLLSKDISHQLGIIANHERVE